MGLTPDEKWDWVRIYFEKAYRIKFKERLKDSDVNDLYKKAQTLLHSRDQFYFEKPFLEVNFKKLNEKAVLKREIHE